MQLNAEPYIFFMPVLSCPRRSGYLHGVCDLVPVSPGLLLEQRVAVVHAFLRGDINASVGVVVDGPAEHVVHLPGPVVPHVALRPPHHVHGAVSRRPEEGPRPVQKQRHAGVRDHTEVRPAAHVPLETASGSVVHPPHAAGTLDLGSRSAAQDLTGTGHHAAHVTA